MPHLIPSGSGPSLSKKARLRCSPCGIRMLESQTCLRETESNGRIKERAGLGSQRGGLGEPVRRTVSNWARGPGSRSHGTRAIGPRGSRVVLLVLETEKSALTNWCRLVGSAEACGGPVAGSQAQEEVGLPSEIVGVGRPWGQQSGSWDTSS